MTIGSPWEIKKMKTTHTDCKFLQIPGPAFLSDVLIERAHSVFLLRAPAKLHTVWGQSSEDRSWDKPQKSRRITVR